MNQVKLNELIKNQIISIPLYVLKMYPEFNLTADEMVLFLFLYDKDNQVFDPEYISKSLAFDLRKVMVNIASLSDKGLINVVTKTNENNIKEEVIDLSPLFNKISLKIISELNKVNDEDLNIYHVIEEEFNRKLTPMECEMIDEWKKNNYGSELILAAIREATLNGVTALRYIDKILYDWHKKGYRKPSDIKKEKEIDEKVEIFNCDWLDSDEEI